jgi:flagellar hook-associated protein 2
MNTFQGRKEGIYLASAILDNAYNYFLTTYGTSTVSRYDAHKKSELRNTYNNIVKVNKESPLYKIKETGDIDKFAIDIKENARDIKNVIASLSEKGQGIESSFQKKVAVSDQDDIVGVNYVGNGNESEDDRDTSFTVEVKQLATGQKNLGNFLKDNSLDILPGSYSFDLTTTTNSYEFQYKVNPDDTNRSILGRLSNLINSAGIGLSSSLISDDNNNTALEIQSKQTGINEGEPYLFHIAPDGSNLSRSAIGTLGIDQIASEAHNSAFLLNGQERSSFSNKFTINNTFELTLNGISEDDNPAKIGYKTNVEAISDNIGKLVSSYNKMIQTAHDYSDRQQDSSKLLSDMGNVAKGFKGEFERIGLMVQDDGSIQIDHNLLTDAVSSEDSHESFAVLNQFKDALNAKADSASINPMNYVNKLIVAYKNPGHNFSTPYITSIYSGMMLDRYC